MLRCRLRGKRGQVATIILVLIAVVLLLAMSTFNVGMVSLMKVETSNAADAASLGASSWVASGQNEVAMGPAKTMWEIYLAYQAMLLLPFGDVWTLVTVWLSFNQMEMWRAKIANEILHASWQQARSTALMAALNQAGVDDQRKAVEAGSFGEYQFNLAQQFRAIMQAPDGSSLDFPPYLEFTWDRNPDDPERGEQYVKVEAEFSNVTPDFKTSIWGPIGMFWSPPIGWCSWGPPPAWKSKMVNKNLQYLHMPLKLAIPWYGHKKGHTCFPIPFPLISPWGRPSTIENGDGDITVTVTRRATQEADLRLWQMKYPDVISKSKAHYRAAKVTIWPSPRSLPTLEE